jgi:predicted kinase
LHRERSEPVSPPEGPTLCLVYGPPAVGKLTVAKEIAARIGYRLVHNHV